MDAGFVTCTKCSERVQVCDIAAAELVKPEHLHPAPWHRVPLCCGTPGSYCDQPAEWAVDDWGYCSDCLPFLVRDYSRGGPERWPAHKGA